jgi:hypothetical protein
MVGIIRDILLSLQILISSFTLGHPSAIMQAAESCGLESVAKLSSGKIAFNSF